MKKIIVLMLIFTALFGCTSKMGAQLAEKADLKTLEENIQKKFSSQDKNIKVKVTEIKDINDIIPGFSYAEIKLYENGVLVNTDKIITNGKYFTKEFINSASFVSLKDELDFEFAKPVAINTDNLTLAGGNKNAKNVIIEITDFQCPYCKKANSYFVDALKDKSDYALYIVHLPLTGMHPSAEVMAQIFEAGMLMGKNFKNELFGADYLSALENKAKEMKEQGVKLNQELVDNLIKEFNQSIIDEYAAKTDNPAKFKELVNSDEVKSKITATKNLASSLNIDSTPVFYINGKAVSGFNEGLIEKAIENF